MRTVSADASFWPMEISSLSLPAHTHIHTHTNTHTHTHARTHTHTHNHTQYTTEFLTLTVIVNRIQWKLIRWSACEWKLMKINLLICVRVIINWKLIRWSAWGRKLMKINSLICVRVKNNENQFADLRESEF